jgi:hypothetical protein
MKYPKPRQIAKAFERLKNAINNVREKLGHSDDEWVYETDYM